MSIHSTAIVDPSARLGDGVTVGPYTVIGADVEIGDNTWIGPHVVINGPTRIGRENRIHPFASLGDAPQDLGYRGEPTRLEIGDRNLIRESVTINRGTVKGGGLTAIGNDCMLMAYVHIAHDCRLGNEVIFANNASLAGHVTVEDFTFLSGFTMVHQFCSIGAYSYMGMGSAIAKDVPPFVMVAGHPAATHGINRIGLERRGFSPERIKSLRQAYKILYRSGLSLPDAKSQLAEMANESADVAHLLRFVENARRSIVR